MFYEIYGGYSRGSDMYCLTLTLDGSNVVFGLMLCELLHPSQSLDLSYTVEMMAKGEDFEKVDRDSTRDELTIHNLTATKHFWSNNNMLSIWDLQRCDSLILRVHIKVHDDDIDGVNHEQTIDYWSKLAQRQEAATQKDSEMEIVNLDGHDVNDQIEKRFRSVEDQFDSLKATLESMTSRISQLSEDMMRLQERQGIQQNEESKLQKWMENEVKLPQYFELLMENGFEDMESMSDITMEHLREIGIEKMGHRLKLMKGIAKLRAVGSP